MAKAKYNTLFFLPDISGFTQFINTTEVTHAKHIIGELLQLLIDENENAFELAEIEGDALFFYQRGEVSTPAEVLELSKKMFLQFHHHLKLYEQRRMCQCGACSTASQLTLKFVVHGGDAELITLQGKSKPFGPEVVVAHRLLKNAIPDHEYVLLTEGVGAHDLPEWFEETEMQEVFDDVGVVSYCYSSLSEMKRNVPDLPEIPPYPKADKPLVVETELETGLDDAYELISNLDFRDLWNTKVDRLDYQKDKVNRIGESHMCVIDGNNFNFETVTNDFGKDSLVYGERTKDLPILDVVTNYFILKKKDEQTTSLRIESHMKPKKWFGFLLTPIARRLLKGSLNDVVKMISKAIIKRRIRAAS
ncbi:MAG: DUF2652 domain-containing protein [Cyclobacteriaceae bacterium]